MNALIADYVYLNFNNSCQNLAEISHKLMKFFETKKKVFSFFLISQLLLIEKNNNYLSEFLNEFYKTVYSNTNFECLSSIF